MKVEQKLTKGSSITVETQKESEGAVVVFEAKEVSLEDKCKGTYIFGSFAFKDGVSADDVDDFTEELSCVTCFDSEANDEFESYDFGGVVFAYIDADEVRDVVHEYKHLLRYFSCSIYYFTDTHKEVMFHEDNKNTKINKL